MIDGLFRQQNDAPGGHLALQGLLDGFFSVRLLQKQLHVIGWILSL